MYGQHNHNTLTGYEGAYASHGNDIPSRLNSLSLILSGHLLEDTLRMEPIKWLMQDDVPAVAEYISQRCFKLTTYRERAALRDGVIYLHGCKDLCESAYHHCNTCAKPVMIQRPTLKNITWNLLTHIERSSVSHGVTLRQLQDNMDSLMRRDYPITMPVLDVPHIEST